jgi:hypothetical protein
VIVATYLNPVLDPDPLHAAERAHVVGDDDQALAAGMTADLHVMRTAGRFGPLQLGADLTVMRGCFRVERQQVEARHEIFDRGQVVGPRLPRQRIFLPRVRLSPM